MNLSGIEFQLLTECHFLLDGGAMFGHVPKVVWQKMTTPDEYNRVPIACPCLVVRAKDRVVVGDVGMGTKWNAKERDLYGLVPNRFADLLAPCGIAPTDVTDIVLTHLHIDHAGGLTEFGEDGTPRLVFPNAKVFVQRVEWEAALNPDPRSRPSYRPYDFMPILESGNLELIDGDAEILPGVRTEVVGGHTAGHQVIRYAAGETEVVYLGDILPSRAHLKPHWVMGYDLIPLGVMESRKQLLAELNERRSICVLGHDPGARFGRIAFDGKQYCWEALEE